MTSLKPFDVVNIIARNEGEEARLTIRNKMGNPTQIPVRLSNVEMESSTDGTIVTITSKIEYGYRAPVYENYEGKRFVANAKYPATMSRTIKNVIHSEPATIVFWADGTKTVVKAVNEEYDPEKGIAMAFMKKMFGNKGNYFNNIKKWLPKQEAKVEEMTEAEAWELVREEA